VAVLNAVYEPGFAGFSYGARPGRSAHQALASLDRAIERKRVRWVLDADLRDFFGAVNWEWLRKFVRYLINDGGLIRLLNKWLKAGVMENGVVTLSDEGVPQGGPVSPVLSNVYLLHVLDLWFERRFKKACSGYAELTRFADDFVAAFKYHADAVRFRQEMEERLAAFGLRIASEKTALLRFDGNLLHGAGRPASNRRPSPSLVSPIT
jgi:RNA-directed DNA polymerase